MKKLSALLITTVFASASILVACAEESGHGHSHDSTEEHSHKKDDHDDHAHAENDKHEHGDEDHHAHKKESHDEHDADHKHDDHGHEHDEHGDNHGHDHAGHAHHGGIVTMVDGVHHELVITDGKPYLYAEGLPVGDALKAVKVRMTLLRGAVKQDIKMSLVEGNEPHFGADLQLQAGDKIVALIQIGKVDTRLARFDIPAK